MNASVPCAKSRICAFFAFALISTFSNFSQAAAPETQTPIKVTMINSSDGDFIAAVYGEVLKKIGYKVKYVTVDYAAHYTGLVNDDLDVSLAAWQTTGVELTKNALASGKVEDYGPTGVKVTEGWWFPDYVKQLCPGLPNWEALKDPACAKSLSTAETAPQGRYVDAPADWGTQSDKMIQDLGLPLVLVNSGSPAALMATFQGAIDRKEPIVGWMYSPHWFVIQHKGEFVRTQNFHPDVDILKLANKASMSKTPVAAQVLHRFTLSTNDVAIGMDEVDNNGVSPQEAAQNWMADHKNIWNAWVN
ncbi:ABC transporter substrate-binding protein [Pseudomonas sp.]|uniref:ABC transporter substrate-binding protein n=1 Tax=Pseudomonas sp. TaxID=306 RepID=UPI0024876FC0|nr:ABC transporter substrate-binding protein [Pseudomonas sp.]MDI1332511.1 ABC transporter substrate-binding protein [Pseudomonas sp.]